MDMCDDRFVRYLWVIQPRVWLFIRPRTVFSIFCITSIGDYTRPQHHETTENHFSKSKDITMQMWPVVPSPFYGNGNEWKCFCSLQFSSYVNVTKKPMNCTHLRLQDSLFCRIPGKFKDKMKEAMDWFERREIGMVITKTDPPARGK